MITRLVADLIEGRYEGATAKPSEEIARAFWHTRDGALGVVDRRAQSDLLGILYGMKADIVGGGGTTKPSRNCLPVDAIDFRGTESEA